MNDAAYAAVLARGNAGEDLSPVEQYQYARHRSAWIWYWNNVVYQYERGLYDEEEFDVQIELIRADIERYPGLKTHWCVNRGEQASPGLIEAVEVSSTSAYC